METHLDELDGSPLFWRSAPGGIGATPLYVHGAPGTSGDWSDLLTRTGGVSVDLPGFGASGKRGDLDYSLHGAATFLDRFLAHVGIERFTLVAHGWGAAAGLVMAQRMPERVERLVLVAPVPLLPGYRWHRLARVCRSALAGELAMGFATRGLAARVTGMPREAVDRVWPAFDQGTQRAILRLHRETSTDDLAQAGAALGGLSAPALIVWGEADRLIEPAWASAYAAALPAAEVEVVPGAGHWPHLDGPAAAERIEGFLAVSRRG